MGHKDHQDTVLLHIGTHLRDIFIVSSVFICYGSTTSDIYPTSLHSGHRRSHYTHAYLHYNIHTNTKHLHLTHTLSHIHTHVPTIR